MVTGVELDSAFDREPTTAALNKQLSIQQLVDHLSDSAQRVQGKIGVKDMPANTLQTAPKPSFPEEDRSQAVQAPSRPTVNPDKFGLHRSLGTAITAAVSQATSDGRFNNVRDSLTGDQADALMHPPQRPLAEPKNVLTVRTCPCSRQSFVLACTSSRCTRWRSYHRLLSWLARIKLAWSLRPPEIYIQEEEKAALNNTSSPTKAFASLEDSGGLQDIPQGFRRLNSPRSYKQQPDAFQEALKSQVACLPMAFADQLQGHLVDMRSLLGPGVWDRVQRGMTQFHNLVCQSAGTQHDFQMGAHLRLTPFR